MTQKKPENIVEEFVVFLEKALTEQIENSVKKLSFFLPRLFNIEKKSDISVDILKRKEDWYIEDSFAHSLTRRKDISLNAVDLDRHTVVAGATGAGKNVTLDNIMFEYFKKGIPLIFIDPKGDSGALQNFLELNKHFGKKCYVFSESYPLSDKCNPVLEGDTTSIVERIFKIFEWGEQYYADVNYMALQKAVSALKYDKQEVNLVKIRDYIVQNINTDETQNIINKLSKIVDSSFGRLLVTGENEQAVTFSQLREEGASIYIGLSTLGYPGLSQSIGKLFVYELMNHSYQTFLNPQSIRKQMPFAVVIDELGSVITEDFISLVNKCRGAGVGLCVSFQLLSDLDSISPLFRDRLIGNFNNFFIGHTHTPDEAEYWSRLIATKKNEKETHQYDEDSQTGKKSVREVDEFMVHPNIFKSLGIGQFVIFSFFPNRFIDVVKVHNKLNERFYQRHTRIKIKPQIENRNEKLKEKEERWTLSV